MARTVTLKGNPLTLAGAELKVGDKAPDARLRKDLTTDVRISETNGKTRIFSVVPSLDTSVCATQTKRFNQEAANLPDVTIYTISCDLPMAQKRFCESAGINPERVVTLSDHRETAFGQAYGTLIPDLRILSRALFVVDAGGTIRHVEYVPEIATEPNYEAALKVIRGL